MKINRRERLQNLINTACRSQRIDAANSHVEAAIECMEIIGEPLPTVKENMRSYHSFLAGWDAAMELTSDELRDENQVLHGIVMDLCQQLMLKRCPTCQGEGVNLETLEECSECERGWIDVADDSPERIIGELRE